MDTRIQSLGSLCEFRFCSAEPVIRDTTRSGWYPEMSVERAPAYLSALAEL